MRTIHCEKCGKRYNVKDGENGRATSKYKCRACDHVIVVDNIGDSKSSGQPQTTVSPQPHIKTSERDGVAAKKKRSAYDASAHQAAMSQEAVEKAFSLRSKFNMAIGIVFLCSIVLIYFLSGSRLKKDAEQQVFDKARLLLTTMEASRSFTSNVIKPVLYKELPGRFVTEGMSSSFGARNIFERIHKTYPQYYFKHAARYPRNLINQADEFEMSIIEKFTDNADLEEWEGYRNKGDEKEYCIMKPIVAKAKCMLCHSDPAKAPKELLDRYGNENGFNRSVGEVLGTLTVSVPSRVVMDKARRNTMVFTGMVVLFFVVLSLIVNVFFAKVVLQPIQKLAENANEISLGKLDTQINTSGGDEIAVLAKAFNRMKISIKMAFEQLAK
jgi:HAMP domain-containing protein